MKVELKITKEFDVKFLAATAGIRYAEDVEVNGTDCGELEEIPLHDGEHWQCMIDVDAGIILNWPKGTTAKFYSKVCDDGTYSILDENKQPIKTYEGYVPDCLAIDDSGYGDYIIITVDENGKIKNWNPTFEEFQDDDDD